MYCAWRCTVRWHVGLLFLYWSTVHAWQKYRALANIHWPLIVLGDWYRQIRLYMISIIIHIYILFFYLNTIEQLSHFGDLKDQWIEVVCLLFGIPIIKKIFLYIVVWNRFSVYLFFLTSLCIVVKWRLWHRAGGNSLNHHVHCMTTIGLAIAMLAQRWYWTGNMANDDWATGKANCQLSCRVTAWVWASLPAKQF